MLNTLLTYQGYEIRLLLFTHLAPPPRQCQRLVHIHEKQQKNRKIQTTHTNVCVSFKCRLDRHTDKHACRDYLKEKLNYSVKLSS